MVFNATLKNISVISWQSVLLVEETGLMKYYLVRNDMDVNEHDIHLDTNQSKGTVLSLLFYISQSH
jgi:hypothetical protein